MRRLLKPFIKAVLLVLGGLLIGWVSYWAGFSKSLEIGLHINKLNWASQATEYDGLVAELDSGKTEDVRAKLEALSAMLKQEARVPAGSPTSLPDLLMPTGGLALMRDYDADRARSPRRKPDD